MKKLIIFITYGFPNRQRFFEILDLLDDLHVDVVEIGIPVEEASMDGEIIRKCNQTVLSEGIKEENLINDFKRISENYHFKKVLMTYQEAFDTFPLRDLAKYVDGYLCADKHLENIEKQVHIFHEEMNDDQMRSLLNDESLFAYILSGLGSTGGFDVLPNHYVETVKRVKAMKDIPCYIGFGIKTAADVQSVYEYGGDGAIIGSYFLKKIIQGHSNEQLVEYIQSLKQIARNTHVGVTIGLESNINM